MFYHFTKPFIIITLTLLTISTSVSADEPAITSTLTTINSQPKMQYYLISGKLKQPKDDYNLLLVLPGGNGSKAFEPFVKRIYEHAVPDNFIIAQPIAVKWTEDQKIIWPTALYQTKDMKFTTEQFMDFIVRDISKKSNRAPKHTYVMGWSSSGPALYAAALRKKSNYAGYYIAMSVFKQANSPNLKYAKNRKFYIEHSPDDKVCPYWMAKLAYTKLNQKKAIVKLNQYDGGHGWTGNPYAKIKNALNWLIDKK